MEREVVTRSLALGSLGEFVANKGRADLNYTQKLDRASGMPSRGKPLPVACMRASAILRGFYTFTAYFPLIVYPCPDKNR